MHKFLRGVAPYLYQKGNFIDEEILKMLRTRNTLKAGYDILSHIKIRNNKVDKSKELSSSTGSENRSVRHFNAKPYHPVGFILEASLDNIDTVSERDMFSGYGKKENFKSNQTKEEKVNLLSNFSNRERFSFGGEVILKQTTPDMITGIYLDNKERRFTISDDGRLFKYYVIARQIEAIVLQEKYEKYTGKKLPIIDVETEKEISKEELLESIYKLRNSVGINDLTGVFKLSCQSQAVYDKIGETLCEELMQEKKYISTEIDLCKIRNTQLELEEKYYKSAERRGLLWYKNENENQKPLNGNILKSAPEYTSPIEIKALTSESSLPTESRILEFFSRLFCCTASVDVVEPKSFKSNSSQGNTLKL